MSENADLLRIKALISDERGRCLVAVLFCFFFESVLLTQLREFHIYDEVNGYFLPHSLRRLGIDLPFLMAGGRPSRNSGGLVARHPPPYVTRGGRSTGSGLQRLSEVDRIRIALAGLVEVTRGGHWSLPVHRVSRIFSQTGRFSYTAPPRTYTHTHTHTHKTKLL